ncbi:MAG: hypothetical protein HY696_12615 [Deltaproteobacteria bacterium]|nr:hypothetical protein [Deltaproteobacteria bacterium]
MNPRIYRPPFQTKLPGQQWVLRRETRRHQPSAANAFSARHPANRTRIDPARQPYVPSLSPPATALSVAVIPTLPIGMMVDGGFGPSSGEPPPFLTGAMIVLCAAAVVGLGYTMHRVAHQLSGGWGGFIYGPFVTIPAALPRVVAARPQTLAEPESEDPAMGALPPLERGAILAYDLIRCIPKPFGAARVLRNATKAAARVATLRTNGADWNAITIAAQDATHQFEAAIKAFHGNAIMLLVATEQFAAHLQQNAETTLAEISWRCAGTLGMTIGQQVRSHAEKTQQFTADAAAFAAYCAHRAAVAYINASHCATVDHASSPVLQHLSAAEAAYQLLHECCAALERPADVAKVEVTIEQLRYEMAETIATFHRRVLQDAAEATACRDSRANAKASAQQAQLFPPWTEYVDVPWIHASTLLDRLNADFEPIESEIERLRQMLDRLHTQIEDLHIDGPLDAVAAEVLEIVAGWLRRSWVVVTGPLASRAERERERERLQANAVRQGRRLEQLQTNDLRDTATTTFSALLEAVRRHAPLHPEAEEIARAALLTFLRQRPEWTSTLLEVLLQQADMAPSLIFNLVTILGTEQPGWFTAAPLDLLRFHATRHSVAIRAWRQLQATHPHTFAV